MTAFVPIYTTVSSVKIRLTNKVQFQTDPNVCIEGQIPNELLGQLIVDAETEVEQDLRSRYAIPFRSKTTGDFEGLPDHSKRALRIAVDLKAVTKILETDFGSGTHINAEDYFKTSEEHYEKQIMKLLGRDQIGQNDKIDRFKYSPPLDDVLLAKSNSAADDGFRGTIINTDASTHDAASYAANQINNPSKSYIRKRGFGGI